MIEVTKFRLKGDVTPDVFLAKNAAFQQFFVYQQEGLLRRTVASGLEGEWVAIARWRSMDDARRAVRESAASPIALEYRSVIEAGTETREYFKELPG